MSLLIQNMIGILRSIATYTQLLSVFIHHKNMTHESIPLTLSDSQSIEL